MESISKELEMAGLSGNESKVYTELIKNGSLSANETSKKANIDRTLTYGILNKLVRKGLASYTIKENKKIFQVTSTENLLIPIKEKESLISQLIPRLEDIKKGKESPSEIEIYEGKRGLRILLKEILKGKSFCSFGSTGKAYESLYESPHLKKEFERKKLSGRVIGNTSLKNHEIIKIEGIKFKFNNLESEATTTIFNDKIAIHIPDETPLIIMIKNPKIANTYRKHFEVMWSSLN